jgi:hypothetical protein
MSPWCFQSCLPHCLSSDTEAKKIILTWGKLGRRVHLSSSRNHLGLFSETGPPSNACTLRKSWLSQKLLLKLSSEVSKPQSSPSLLTDFSVTSPLRHGMWVPFLPVFPHPNHASPFPHLPWPKGPWKQRSSLAHPDSHILVYSLTPRPSDRYWVIYLIFYFLSRM